MAIKFNGVTVIDDNKNIVNVSNATITGSLSLEGTQGTLTPAEGGTGIDTYTTGDLLYASSDITLSKLAIAPGGNVLISGATPSWGLAYSTSNTNSAIVVRNGDGSVAVGNIVISGSTGGVNHGILFGDGTFMNTRPNYQASVFSYTGDGNTTSFSTSPISADNENHTMVYISGVYQRKSAYSWSGTNLIFSSAPPTNSAIEINVVHADSIELISPNSSPTLSSVTLSGGNLLISESGKGVKFSDGTLQTTAVVKGSYSTATFTGNGSNTAFTISSGRSVHDILVFVEGICKVPTDDYTVSGTTLTFISAPGNGAKIAVRYLPL